MMAIINGNGKTSNNHHHSHHASSSSSSTTSCDDENVMCPLCMENLDIDDKSFYPCTCGYQICRFCWHRIRSESDDQNGLCPACRKVYTENPANFKPLSTEDIQKLKVQKRKQDQQKKQKSENGKRHLADLRVVQKNLVFVVGISPRIADPDVLKKNEFFGKFGKIHKVVVNPCLQGTTASAYITYIRSDDALRAIQSVNNSPFDGKTIKVSLGTTKYCSHFMRNQNCPKSECMYLHHYGDAEASFTKEDMQAGKHQEYEKKLIDEFNASNNNNVEEQQRTAVVETKPPVVQERSSQSSGTSKKKTAAAAVQQGVSYSTKLLVNQSSGSVGRSVPIDPPCANTSEDDDDDPEYDDAIDDGCIPKPDSPAPQSSSVSNPQVSQPPAPCSSSSNSICSDNETQNVETTANLLESVALTEDESSQEPDNYDDYGQSNLDLDFDPFLETQKVFQEIINEQVEKIDDGNSLLRRFITPHQHQQDYGLGFQSNSSQNAGLPQHNHAPQQQQQQQQQTPHPLPQLNHMHQNTSLPYNSSSNSSLLLDFFNSYAYKQTPTNSIPPPPGFTPASGSQPPNLLPQSSTPSSTPSSQILDKLSRMSHQQNCWDAIPETHTTPDWMSLDPAIIFSKSTNEQQQQQQRRFDVAAMFERNFGENRMFPNGVNNSPFTQQQLIRPTPTSSFDYGYNGLMGHSQSPNQQPPSPSPQNYGYNQPRYGYTPQQQQQMQNQTQNNTARYYGTQSTPPPPGFGLAKQPQYSNQNVYVPQPPQQHNAAGFFPF